MAPGRGAVIATYWPGQKRMAVPTGISWNSVMRGVRTSFARDEAAHEAWLKDAETRGPGKLVYDPDFIVPIGRAKIERAGAGVTIVAYSRMVAVALEAAARLAEEGIEAEVINLRTLRPLDTDTIIASVTKTNRIVSVEEGWPYAGIGAEIAAQVIERAFDWLDAPPVRVCGADVPMPYAANLEQLAVPQVATVVDAARRACYRG